jgi:hypothetical protein
VGFSVESVNPFFDESFEKDQVGGVDGWQGC